MKVYSILFLLSLSLPLAATNPLIEEVQLLQEFYDESILENHRQELGDQCVANGTNPYLCEVLTTTPAPRYLLQKQMNILKETLKKTDHTNAIDETLRWQVWNLAYSLKSLENPPTEALLLLEQALAIYQKVKMRIATATQEPELQNDPDYNHLLAIAGNDQAISTYARNLEKMAGLRHWGSDKKRCGATARAVIFAFASKHHVQGNIKEMFKHPKKGAGSLADHILAHHNDKNDWMYFADSARFDHVFVVQKTKEGTYRIYQSFVNQYSLESELTHVKNLSLEEVLSFVSKLELIDSSDRWTDEVDATFEEIFYTRSPRFIRETFAQSEPDFEFVAIPFN